MLIVPLLAMLGAAGCAQMTRLMARAGEQEPPSMVVAPAAAPTEAPAESLAEIVNDELQLGHYAEGEKALRRYLQQHPGDRAAQAMLRQLTVDPKQPLGRHSRAYVVRAGDSYSTLAARYLGNPSQFLILARYNGSTNPSLLRVGETLRLPVSAAGVSRPPVTVAPGADDADRTVAVQTISAGAAPELHTAKARRLQKEIALLGEGQQEQALARLDEELILNPLLRSAETEAASLRKQVVATYHQQAIALYRDQQLDQAVALWDRVLAIVPDYEPALTYRARALELQRRLK